jgi:integrase
VHRKVQQQFPLAIGIGAAAPSDPVVSSPEGGHLNPDFVSRQWRDVVLSRKLPRVSFQALRHGHASALIAAGRDVLTVGRRLGHASASITLGVDGHIFKDLDAAAASAIEAAMKW